MCPVAMLPAMALAGSVVSAAGSIYGGMAANAQGKYEQKIAERNAKLAAEAAADSENRGKLENQQLGREVARTKGQQAAAMAASGVDIGFGSAAAMQEDTAMLAREDADSLYQNIYQRSRGFDIQASNVVAEGKAARFRGKQAMIGSFFEAGSTLLSGATQFRKLRAELGLPKPK